MINLTFDPITLSHFYQNLKNIDNTLIRLYIKTYGENYLVNYGHNTNGQIWLHRCNE